jgi:hypothetical protein
MLNKMILAWEKYSGDMENSKLHWKEGYLILILNSCLFSNEP